MALRLHILFFILLSFQFQVFGQETREDIEKKANAYFKSEKYIEATPLFLRLISLEPRNADYNYKYGTCLLFNSEEKKKAFKYLNYAVNVGKDVEVEAYYFLGKAYHLTFQFDKAIRNYNLYKQKAGNRAVSKLQVDRQIEMCKNGKSLMADITETVVLKKTKIDKESFFRIYDLSDIGGEILVTEEFQTRQDKRYNHTPIIHFPSNSNRIYYSSYGESGDNKDIYVRTRLPDRTWSKAQAVFGNVNTEYNEDFPYMSPNKRYLYFCSEGHNSMGGYDIFRSIYDEETNLFGKPENLDIPISSPDNDFLYIVDSLERYAYFASQRTSEGDKVDVYQVRVQRIPLQFVIIKGGFISLINPNEKVLSITIKNNSGEVVGDFKTSPEGDYLINLPKGGRYEFILNVAEKEQNVSHFIEVPYLQEFRPLKQKIIESEQEGEELVEIINLFDDRFDDEEAIIAEALELRSRMNVNKDDFDLDSLDKIFEQRKVLNEIGLSAYSNVEINDLIAAKHQDLEQRQEKTEAKIEEITQELVQENKKLENSLRKTDSLMNIAKATENNQLKERNILLAYQNIQEANKIQKKIKEANKTLLHLGEDYENKKRILEEAKTLKEGVSTIDISEDAALYSLLDEHKDFSKKELIHKTRQDALLEYQEELSKQTEQLTEIENKKKNLQQEIQRAKEKIDDLHKSHEQASRKDKQSIDTDISRAEIALEDLNMELSYLQQQEEQLNQVDGTPEALTSLLEGTGKNSVLNASNLKEVSQKSTELNNQQLRTENTHSELAQEYKIDLTKDPSTIIIPEDITEDLAENNSAEGEQSDPIHSSKESGGTGDTSKPIEKEVDKDIKEPEKLTQKQINELANSPKRKVINQNNVKLQKDFSELNEEYILSKKQHTKNFDLIEAEVKQTEIEKLIYQLEKETDPIQYQKLQNNIEKQQNEVLEAIKKETTQQEINHFIEGELSNGNYDFINSEDLIETEEGILQEQDKIKVKIQELLHKIEQNNTALPSQSSKEQEITKRQNRQFKIIVEELEFRYKKNQEKLIDIAADKATLKLTQSSTDNIEKNIQNSIAQSDTYKEAKNIHNEISANQIKVASQQEELAKNKMTLKRVIDDFKNSEELTPQDKETIVNAITQLNEQTESINHLKDETLQLMGHLEAVIANKDKNTQEAILSMLEENVKSIPSSGDLVEDSGKDTAEENTKKTSKAEVDSKEPTTKDALQTAHDNLDRLTKKEEMDPNMVSNKAYQKQVNSAKIEVILQEKKRLKNVLHTIEKSQLATSGDSLLPVNILELQQSVIEVEYLTSQAEKEKDPVRKQEILDQIIELQNNNINQAGAHLRQQEQDLILQQAINDNQLENLSVAEVKESEESLIKKRDNINIQVLELEDKIKEIQIERNQAKKRDKEKYTQTIIQLEAIKKDFLTQQEINQDILTSIAHQKNLDKNKGVAEDAIETVLTYEDEVEIAQSDIYKDLFKDINQLHQKQDELKVKTEALNNTKKALNQIITMDTPNADSLVSADELEAPLKNINKLTSEIVVLREEISALQKDIQSQLIAHPEKQAKIENLIARDVAPIKEAITLKTIETGLFMTGALGSYSDDNPIPIVENTIGGLIFRVQIGAFSKPVPNNTFDEFHPISGETVRPGLIRYVAGLFNNRGTAEQARDQIRALGYSDAFVVAYCDGERIPVYRAVELMNSGACVPEIEVETDQLFVQASEAPSTEGFTNNKGELDLFAYNQGPDAAKAEAAEAKMGLYYTVQVGVYNRPVSAAQLFHISPLVTKRLPNGQIRYSSGIFNSVSEARPKRADAIEKGVDDAFITAYYQGNRISLNEAEALLKELGEEILELNNPTIKRGNEIVNKPTVTTEETKKPFLQGKETQTILISKDIYSEYPTQVLNRLNEVESQFYYDSITRSIKSILLKSNHKNISIYSDNFETIEVYNKTYKVIDKAATSKKEAVEDISVGQIHLSIEVDALDINSDLIVAIYNAPYTKEIAISEKGISADFYVLNTGNNENKIDLLKALLAKLGATFHAKYN